MKKLIYLSAMVAAAAATAVAPTASHAAPAGSAAGKYHLTSSLKCVDGPQNAQACAKVDSSTYPVMGKRGTTFMDRVDGRFSVDSHGKMTYALTEWLTERVPGKSALCSAKSGAVEFNGTCRLTETGKGFVRKGATGLLDFWVTQVSITFHGPRVTHENATVKGSDTEAPAVSGHWNASSYLRLLGVHSVPAGIAFSSTVTRT